MSRYKITVSGKYASPGEENNAHRGYVCTLLGDLTADGSQVEVCYTPAADEGCLLVEKGQG